jgi:hypothetical protein
MTLDEEIESELQWLAQGEPAGPSLEFEARDAIRRILARHQIRGARIIVRSQGSSLHVDVRLPPTVPRVRKINIRFG